MPVNKSMMAAMQKQYGKEKGKSVYYAVEQKKKSLLDRKAGKK